jgi:hypothetical protein
VQQQGQAAEVQQQQQRRQQQEEAAAVAQDQQQPDSMAAAAVQAAAAVNASAGVHGFVPKAGPADLRNWHPDFKAFRELRLQTWLSTREQLLAAGERANRPLAPPQGRPRRCLCCPGAAYPHALPVALHSCPVGAQCRAAAAATAHLL